MITLLWWVIAVSALFSVLVLVAAGYGAYSARRSIEVASHTPCPKCGKPFGRLAVLAAKERCSQKAAEMRRQNPNVKFRMVAEWEIHCPNCGGIFYFYPESNAIETESRFERARSNSSTSV